LAIVYKFISIILLFMALDEYQMAINSNISYFVASIFLSLAAHPMVAPLFTYDHEVCRPTNFKLNQPTAE
jgi:hypothetical protein